MQDVTLAKTPQPTEEHWEQALVAARSAWKRWKLSYRHIPDDDIVPELQYECMTQYVHWDPTMVPWFPWACYICRKRLSTMLQTPRMLLELLVSDPIKFEKPVEEPRLLPLDETYNKLHPFDRWVVGLRGDFCTNLEAVKYMRLCGVPNVEIQRSSRRIWNAAHATTNRLAYGEWKRKACSRLDALLIAAKAAELTITQQQMMSIMEGMFTARIRNVVGPHRKHITQYKIQPCDRKKPKTGQKMSTNNHASRLN